MSDQDPIEGPVVSLAWPLHCSRCHEPVRCQCIFVDPSPLVTLFCSCGKVENQDGPGDDIYERLDAQWRSDLLPVRERERSRVEEWPSLEDLEVVWKTSSRT